MLFKSMGGVMPHLIILLYLPTYKMKDIIIFDGICNFCDGYVNFIIDHDKSDRFRFAPIQSEIAQNLLADFNITNIDSIILIKDGRCFIKSDAIFEMLPHLDSVVRRLMFLKIIPRIIRNYAYDFISRHRYLLMGKLNECRLPTIALREKFLS